MPVTNAYKTCTNVNTPQKENRLQDVNSNSRQTQLNSCGNALPSDTESITILALRVGILNAEVCAMLTELLDNLREGCGKAAYGASPSEKPNQNTITMNLQEACTDSLNSQNYLAQIRAILFG